MTGAGRTGFPTPGGICTIVIATLARADRAASLSRAIDSLQAGNRVVPDILIVVNGNVFDPELVRELDARPDIRVHRIETGSLPAAILAGRQQVATPFFGFLDDDDEYLPGAIDARIDVMIARPNVGLVVTNGYRHLRGADRIAMRFQTDVEADPLAALFTENWLASCGGLFRSRDITVDLFDDIARYLEWSWLGFRLASAGKRVAVLNRPTFRIHDTEGSESKSDAYMESQVRIFERMLSETTRRDIAEVLGKRISQAWHDASARHLRRGRRGEAWIAHLRSLVRPAGWRFIPYTRHLLVPGGLRSRTETR